MKSILSQAFSLVAGLGLLASVASATTTTLQFEFNFDGADKQANTGGKTGPADTWGIFLDHAPGAGWDWSNAGLFPMGPSPAAWKLTGETGTFGGIFYFTATSQTLPSQYSISMWINPEEKTTGNNLTGLISNTYEGDSQNGFQLSLNTPDAPGVADDGRLAFNTGDGTNNIKLTSAPGVVTLGQWQLITLVVDTTVNNAKVYVNDTKVIDGTILSGFANGGYTFCGNIGNSYPYKGLIDIIRVYYGLVTEDDIASLMTNGPLVPVELSSFEME